jgi:hypothetical protein
MLALRIPSRLVPTTMRLAATGKVGMGGATILNQVSTADQAGSYYIFQKVVP